MRSDRLRTRVEDLLAAADVSINGSRPWDLQVHDERQYADALAARALGLEPDLPWARYAMGAVLLRRGDVQGFVRQARLALELERDSHTLAGLGTYLAEVGRTDDARRYADEALALDPLTWFK